MNWTWFIAVRHFVGRRQEQRFSPTILSVVGITVGVMALISVMAVMNGFQLAFIEDILEIESYHIRITPSLLSNLQSGVNDGSEPLRLREEVESMAELPGIRIAVPCVDVQTLANGEYSGLRPVMVRGIDTRIASGDREFLQRLGISASMVGDLAVGSVILGADLAITLGTAVGEEITVLSLAKGSGLALNPSVTRLRLAGVFRSETYEFNSAMAFVPLETGLSMASGIDDLFWGIKLTDKDRDIRGMNVILEYLGRRGFDTEAILAACESWRDFNRSFFGALRTEKVTMMVLVGLIFVVVGVNIYHALRREVRERQEEIGVLRSLGASPRQIRGIFTMSGVLVGLVGSTLGTMMGLLVSAKINTILQIADRIINRLVDFAYTVSSVVTSGGGQRMGTLIPSIFNAMEVPVRVLLPETAAIFAFAFASSVTAARIASRRVVVISPAEVLRFE